MLKRWVPLLAAGALGSACASFQQQAELGPVEMPDASVQATQDSYGPTLQDMQEIPDAPPVLCWLVWQQGRASWYGKELHGRRTASGERFDMRALTAAHPSLPLGSRVKVRDPASGREVLLRINDRGPATPGRIIDVSHEAARQLGWHGRGLAQVQVLLATMLPGGTEPVPVDGADCPSMASGGSQGSSTRATVP